MEVQMNWISAILGGMLLAKNEVLIQLFPNQV